MSAEYFAGPCDVCAGTGLVVIDRLGPRPMGQRCVKCAGLGKIGVTPPAPAPPPPVRATYKGDNVDDYDTLVAKYPMLKFLRYQHLPPQFQEISKLTYELALHMARTLPSNAETSTGLRKLREAKDCFVSAAIP